MALMAENVDNTASGRDDIRRRTDATDAEPRSLVREVARTRRPDAGRGQGSCRQVSDATARKWR